MVYSYMQNICTVNNIFFFSAEFMAVVKMSYGRAGFVRYIKMDIFLSDFGVVYIFEISFR